MLQTRGSWSLKLEDRLYQNAQADNLAEASALEQGDGSFLNSPF